MDSTIKVKISDPSGVEHECDAVIGPGEQRSVEVKDILIPFSLHGQFYDDNGHECGMDMLVDSICFNINEGSLLSASFASGYHYECERALLLSQDVQPESFYVVGDLVNQLYGKSVTESARSGALIFSDELSAKAVVDACPWLTMFELEPEDADIVSKNMSLVTNSVAVAFAKQALTRMKEDYGDIDIARIIQSVGERYFPESLPRQTLVSLQKSLFLHSSDGVELDLSVDSFVTKAQMDDLLVASASKELVLNRFTIKEKDVNNYIPKTSSKGEILFHDFTLDVLGESIDGSMVFFQKQAPYFGGREDSHKAEPIAFFSPDNAGGVVVYNHPTIKNLSALVLAKMSSYDDVDPSTSYCPKVKNIK